MSTNVEGQFVSPNDAKTNVVRSAYYTPTLEEFHVGFECEWQSKIRNETWNKQICDTDLVNIAYDAIEHADEEEPFKEQFRVKYLDKEDCLSLGLELKIWDNGSGYFQKGSYTIGIYETDLFCTVGQNDYGNNIIRFSGDLKNKSELKRILHQTGCVQS